MYMHWAIYKLHVLINTCQTLIDQSIRHSGNVHISTNLDIMGLDILGLHILGLDVLRNTWNNYTHVHKGYYW